VKTNGTEQKTKKYNHTAIVILSLSYSRGKTASSTMVLEKLVIYKQRTETIPLSLTLYKIQL
jgi:hypothetical protein